MSTAEAPSGDIVEAPENVPPGLDHDRLEVFIPMRDGVRLHTLILIPRDASDSPIVLDRTPYGPKDILAGPLGPLAAGFLHPLQADLFASGYILAIQTVRGKFQSEGAYELNRPVHGAFNVSDTDHVTDGWDTVAWLAGNVTQSNGRVAALGLSYDGFTALMHLFDPHPALAACVAINAMVDCWKGDDWFRNGAFRQFPAAHYVRRQTTAKGTAAPWPSRAHDEYQTWLDAGSAHQAAERLGIAGLPAWRRLEAHPAYDAYWQSQALDRLLRDRDVIVPTLHVHSQFDVEDPYGPTATFAALRDGASHPERHHLVTGPWSHACTFFTDGAELGPLRFGCRTAQVFRRELLIPFLDALTRAHAARAPIPQVTAFSAGLDRWLAFTDWPPRAPDALMSRLFLKPGFRLGEDEPASGEGDGCDAYVSDPRKPVTHQPRPIPRKDAPGFAWERLGVLDQRFAGDRPDVLRYTSHPLREKLQLAGQPLVKLFASTTGTDADWIVKLIDLYPDAVREDAALASYELAISSDVFRARYRKDLGQPEPVPSGEVLEYTFRLPHVCRTILAGHSLMLQVQSTSFPLYDRNPQAFVPNIFFAKESDYQVATHRVFRRPDAASYVELPVIALCDGECSPRALQ